MKEMLDLLYEGYLVLAACYNVSDELYRKYMGKGEYFSDLSADDLTTMLLLIAVAEGEVL